MQLKEEWATQEASSIRLSLGLGLQPQLIISLGPKSINLPCGACEKGSKKYRVRCAHCGPSPLFAMICMGIFFFTLTPTAVIRSLK